MWSTPWWALGVLSPTHIYLSPYLTPSQVLYFVRALYMVLVSRLRDVACHENAWLGNFPAVLNNIYSNKAGGGMWDFAFCLPASQSIAARQHFFVEQKLNDQRKYSLLLKSDTHVHYYSLTFKVEGPLIVWKIFYENNECVWQHFLFLFIFEPLTFCILVAKLKSGLVEALKNIEIKNQY